MTTRILSHYSKHPGKEFLDDYSMLPLDNEHKPGGLWLSDDSDFGWYASVSERKRSGSSEWADGDELLRYRYDFTIDPNQLDQVLTLATPHDLRRFTAHYREGRPRECVVDGTPGYGTHIEWHRVKSDYKGILITPFLRDLSHRNGDPDFHWYRFDCASGCLWDITCLNRVQ